MVNCPYCGASNNEKQCIDKCHRHLKNMGRKGNTINIYSCKKCGETYDTSTGSDLRVPVDVFFAQNRSI